MAAFVLRLDRLALPILTARSFAMFISSASPLGIADSIELASWPRDEKHPPVRTLQHPLTAAPKMSGFFLLLNRHENSLRYSGRYFLLTL